MNARESENYLAISRSSSLLSVFWHTDKNFGVYAEVKFDWMRLDSALKKSLPRYISAQKISTLFDALDEREIAR
jgi:hypothetical protein